MSLYLTMDPMRPAMAPKLPVGYWGEIGGPWPHPLDPRALEPTLAGLLETASEVPYAASLISSRLSDRYPYRHEVTAWSRDCAGHWVRMDLPT